MITEEEYMMYAAERFKKEHQDLLALLYRIQVLVTKAMAEQNPNQAILYLYEAKPDVTKFLRNLKEHAVWEEEAWYPLLRKFSEEHLVPHAAELLDTVEEDNYLAKMFAKTFLTKLEKIAVPIRTEEVQNTAMILNQTCYLLWEHFAREEELMEPVALH